jgi:hypothetical protein
MIKPVFLRIRGGLGPKSLRGNRFYKNHREIAEKASIPLKISLAILEKASISLKKSSKIFANLYKSPTFLNRTFHFSGNVFK